MLMFNVFSFPLMFFAMGFLGIFCQKLSPDVLVEVVAVLGLDLFKYCLIIYFVKIL